MIQHQQPKSVAVMAQECMLSIIQGRNADELNSTERDGIVYVSIQLAKELHEALKGEDLL